MHVNTHPTDQQRFFFRFRAAEDDPNASDRAVAARPAESQSAPPPRWRWDPGRRGMR